MNLETKCRLMQMEIEEAEQILGKALGYPPYPIYKGMDYTCSPAKPTNKPDSNYVCIGDNTLLSLCDEVATKFAHQKHIS